MSIQAYIPWILTGIAIIISWRAYTHNLGADTQSLRDGIIKANMKLDQVCNTTNDIKVDLKAQENRLNEVDKEIAVVRRDVKTAFNNIDELREELHEHERSNKHERVD